jgi:hypothetical protein
MNNFTGWTFGSRIMSRQHMHENHRLDSIRYNE